MSVIQRIVARLKEQSGYLESVKFVQLTAQRVLGEVQFDPPADVNISGGVAHMHIIPDGPTELSKVRYFAKLVQGANHLRPRVISVSPDTDKSKYALRVEFSRS